MLTMSLFIHQISRNVKRVSMTVTRMLSVKTLLVHLLVHVVTVLKETANLAHVRCRLYSPFFHNIIAQTILKVITYNII